MATDDRHNSGSLRAARQDGDLLTGAVAVVALGLLFRFKISNPALVALAAITGLIAFPLLKPNWVLIK
jgi:chromate transporter